jgi:CRISPR system Cascade subunit CasB
MTTTASDRSETAPTNTPPRWTTLGTVGTVVDSRLRALQEGLRANTSSSTATLARLRRGLGKPAGSIPEIWQITMSDEFVPAGSGDAPTPAETAAHVAMTLYAVHQQSAKDRMHRRGYGLGRSARLLSRHVKGPDGETDPVRRRFQSLATADSLDELVHHARGLVQQFRPAAIPMDYGLFADQLVIWQTSAGASRIRLQWGRDFYRQAHGMTVPPCPDPILTTNYF